MTLRAVADASFLIALNQLGLLDRLAPLFAALLIPPAVAREIAPSVDTPSWVRQFPSVPLVPTWIRNASLGPGESEAIALVLELNGYWLVLDDRRARRLTTGAGIPVIGTVGILVRAKHTGLLTALRPSFAMLRTVQFHVSLRLLNRVLAEEGEEPLAEEPDER